MLKLQLSFHTIFTLRKENLLKIVQASAENRDLNHFTKRLRPCTGLGTKKVILLASVLNKENELPCLA